MANLGRFPPAEQPQPAEQQQVALYIMMSRMCPRC